MKVVCYEHVCYELLGNERVCSESGQLSRVVCYEGCSFWTGFIWTFFVVNVVC